MKVFRSSKVDRIELLVPVIKDVTFLSDSGLAGSSGTNGDPLNALVFNKDSLDQFEKRGELLKVVDEAEAALAERARETKASLMLIEIQERLNDCVGGSTPGLMETGLRIWQDLCADPTFDKPVQQDLPKILLHSPDAWRQLEAALKSVSFRFFISQHFVRGRYDEDGTIDLSLVYTLLTRRKWNPTFPNEICEALRPFCQRQFFATVNGRCALYTI
jgi:hypothetical protein